MPLSVVSSKVTNKLQISIFIHIKVIANNTFMNE
mgnify:CR=1 FL=1